MKDNSDIKCAMYCRYSSFLQRDTSIDDQINTNEEFAMARGWKVLKEHTYVLRAQKNSERASMISHLNLSLTAISEEILPCNRNIAETLFSFPYRSASGIV